MNGEKAADYAAQYKFSIFPVHGVYSHGGCTCGNAQCGKMTGKHPATPKGFKDATSDPTKILNNFASSRPFNIGIATGAVSNIFVIDVDGMEGESSLSILITSHGPLPKTLTSLTGGGQHIFFRYPQNQTIKNSTSKLAPKIDIRGDGGYVIAPPSLHQTGAYYQWDESQGGDIADAPAWLLDLLQPPVTNGHAPEFIDYSHSTDTWSATDIEHMLSFIDPDITYDEWISIGMALNQSNYPMAIFNNWSARGNKYAGIKNIESHWKSFRKGGGITIGTLIATAQLHGWKPSEDYTNPLIELGRQAAQNIFTATKLQTISSQSQDITIDFDNLPGIIGQTVQWILSSAQKPQPELALLNTITALGAIFGRRYRSPLDTRTNIYMVGLAGTASGKNHSKKLIKSLLAEANLLDFLGSETIISGAGLLSSVSKQPSQIMHLDEFGMLLEAIMDKRGAGYMKIASKIITELYSNSSEKYIGGQYADKKIDRTIIANPNLCVFGISTMEKYTSSLNREAISSGELNRFIVYRASQDNPKRRRGVLVSAPPEWLVKAWKDLYAHPIPQNGMIELSPLLVAWPGLQDRIDDMGDFEDNNIIANVHGAGALWGRYRENVIKVAMIFAIARNPIKPEIIPQDLDIAEALIRQSVDFMINMVNEFLADSQHEKDCNDILQYIKKAEGTIGRSILRRKTQRMDKKQLDNAIISLIEQDKIMAISLDKTGKPGPGILSYQLR